MELTQLLAMLAAPALLAVPSASNAPAATASSARRSLNTLISSRMGPHGQVPCAAS